MTRRVLVAGAWDDGPGYPRPRAMFGALAALGEDVAVARVELPGNGEGKRRLVAAPWRWPGHWLALRGGRRRLVRAVRAAAAEHRPDVVLVPYPGHVVAPWLRGTTTAPIVLDLFLSAHDTAVGDRGLLRPGSAAARCLAALDARACRAANLVLLDTEAHARRIAAACGLPDGRFGWVPIAPADEPAAPLAPAARLPGAPFELLFVGTGIPLHGLDVLIRAAAACPGVRLTLVGGSAGERALARDLLGGALELRAEFEPWPEVWRLLGRSHAVAGIFGTSPKAGCVVPYKVVHGLSAGRPVVTADTVAARAVLRDGREGRLVPAGDVAALAAALRDLAGGVDRLAAMGEAARAAFDRSFSRAAVAARLDEELARVAGTPAAPAPAPAVGAGR